MTTEPEDATQLLSAIASGNKNAWNKLLSVVYQELHSMAHNAMRKERPGQTLQTTALVHEAYLSLCPGKNVSWQDRQHFFRVAARAMRNILAGEARKKKAAKRGGGVRHLTLLNSDRDEQLPNAAEISFDDLDALDRALEKLNLDEANERLCAMVELRFFVGLTLDETAEILSVSKATVKRDWEFTRAWLYREMGGGG